MKNAMKLYLNSLYGKMVSKLTDEQEKFALKCFKHAKDGHIKNCTITITQVSGNHVSIHTYKLDDYRVATAINNILDNVRYTECHYTSQDKSSLYDYIDTDSAKEKPNND